MTIIQDIQARELLDSRGQAILECEVTLECGALGRAVAPVGVPKEMRDGDERRFGGRGVGLSLSHVRDLISTPLRGMDGLNQVGVDRALGNLDSIGGNSSFGVSLAVCHAAALALEIPLCRYLGGLRGSRLPDPIVTLCRSSSGSQFGEFLAMSRKTGMRFKDKLRMLSELSQGLLREFENRGVRFNQGFEGIDVLDVMDCDILDSMRAASEYCGYSLESDVAFGLARPLPLDMTTVESRSEGLQELLKEYPITYVELDWVKDEIASLSEALKGILVCGVSSSCNGRVVEMSSASTVTELLGKCDEVRCGGRKLVFSACGACGCDDSSASELSIAVGAEHVRFGSLFRSENVLKYNQLLRLEEMIS